MLIASLAQQKKYVAKKGSHPFKASYLILTYIMSTLPHIHQ